MFDWEWEEMADAASETMGLSGTDDLKVGGLRGVLRLRVTATIRTYARLSKEYVWGSTHKVE